MKNIPNLGALVDAFSVFENFKWVSKDTSLNTFLHQFQEKVQNCGGIVTDQYIAFRLLTSTNLDKLHLGLDNLNIRELSYIEIKNLLSKIYRDPCNQSVDAEKGLKKSSPLESRGWSGKDSSSTEMIIGEDPTANNRLPLHNKNRTREDVRSNKPVKLSEKTNVSETAKLPTKTCYHASPTNTVKLPTKTDTASLINSLRKRNPANKNGVVSKCVICRSICHWNMDCPHQKLFKVGVDYVMLEKLQKDTPDENPVVITGCVSKSVCGEPWLLSYLDTLSPSSRSQISCTPLSNTFHFEGIGDITSCKEVIIPLTNIGKDIRVSIVDIDIPLLVSRSALIKSDAKVDVVSDTLIMCKHLIYCNVTEEGLLYFLLTNYDEESSDAQSVDSFIDDQMPDDNTSVINTNGYYPISGDDIGGGSYRYPTPGPWGINCDPRDWNCPYDLWTYSTTKYGPPDPCKKHYYPRAIPII